MNSLPIVANAYECEKLGWNFYCDEQEDEQEVIEPVKKQPLITDLPETLEDFKKKLNEAQTQAVNNPTEINVYKYMALKSQAVGKAYKFTQVATSLLVKYPELSERSTYPVSTVAIQARNEHEAKQQESVLQQLHNNYGLLFVFRSDCPYCHKYSPILKNVAQRYSINVLAVSSDGKGLIGWPNAKPNNGQLERLGLTNKPVPATLLIRKGDNKVIPIAYQLLTMDDLKKRLFNAVRGDNDQV